MTTAFDFRATSIDGKPIALKKYQGRALLVVNTASDCGFTPQYKGLQALHEQYKARGLEVLGFPCNQFGGQEPGDAATIGEFCERNYGVGFQMFDKVDVNGDDAHPLFAWLSEQAPGLLGSRKLKWNFTKFLVDRDGKTVKRFAPQDTPESLAADIESALAN